MQAWLVRPQGKTAHAFDPSDRRIPMRAACGYKSWPQDLIQAASCDRNPNRPYRMVDPVYCSKCMS